MWSQTPNEESKERNQEIDKDWSKARQFPTTVIGRTRLRALRRTLQCLGVRVQIPLNSAAYTNTYCIKYGKKEKCAFTERRI